MVTESSKGLEVQGDSVNFINVKDLNKYLDMVGDKITDEALSIIGWLIEHNDTYVDDFGGDNALETFYSKGIPSDENLKKLYGWIGNLKKQGRLLEVPVFQTREQFDGILKKEFALDEIVLDLETEKGRNAVAKKYEPLVHKIANQFHGKSALDDEELFSNGLLGLTMAMNDYGKPSKTAQEQLEKDIAAARKAAEEEGSEMTPDEAEEKLRKDFEEANNKKGSSFKSYASWRIRQAIQGAIANESHTVRIPVSQQAKIKKEFGQIAKSYDVSGDDPLKGHKDDDGNTRTLWDVIGDMQGTGSGLDKEETKLAKEKFMKALKKKVGERNYEWIENAYKSDDDETKIPNGEMAKKWKVTAGLVSSVCSKAAIKKLIMSDPELKKLAYDWFERFEESLHDEMEQMIDSTRPYNLRPVVEGLARKNSMYNDLLYKLESYEASKNTK